jgi:hypothetical protein
VEAVVTEIRPRHLLLLANTLTTVLVLTTVLAGCEQQRTALSREYERQQVAAMEEDINRQAKLEMSRIEHQVVDDQIEQLKITVKHGSPMEICVQAWMVTAALLQAKNEAGYAAWKKVERKACRSNFLPPVLAT